ncbi:MAG: transposase [Candidatus Thorarchaeota archaeon]
MGRSKGKVISVKIPIAFDKMTKKQKTRLSQITGRDTRVIKAYLGIIERHERDLLTGRKQNKIHAGKLDELTLTASRGASSRHQVPHDFKQRFLNISVNEFQECRETAIAMWQSYLERGGSKPLHSYGYTSRKIPRYVFKRRFELIYTPEKATRHWLLVRNAIDSLRDKRRILDLLAIPLSPSSFHLGKLKEGEVKTIRLVKDRFRKWWAIFTVTLEIMPVQTNGKPPAVLAIDLGIKKTACTVLLTQDGYKQVHYWKQEEKIRQMQKYDERVASLQKKKDYLFNSGHDSRGVATALRNLSRKRERLSIDYDEKMVKSVSDHILKLTQKYDLYICIGRVRGIRNKARKGNKRGRAFRGMIHRWSFARVTELLRNKLEILGLDSKRLFSVPESWTSIKCHKCGHKGVRPKQSLFICHTCGYRANADLNGAINIGRRLIMLIPSLQNENTGLGMWLLSHEKSTPNALRSSRSKGKSSLPQRLPTSSEWESVADCSDQTTLESFVSSEDLAMAKTVEEPPATGTSGSSGTQMQRTETGSRQKDHILVKSGKAQVTALDLGLGRLVTAFLRKVEHRSFYQGSLTTVLMKLVLSGFGVCCKNKSSYGMVV